MYYIHTVSGYVRKILTVYFSASENPQHFNASELKTKNNIGWVSISEKEKRGTMQHIITTKSI